MLASKSDLVGTWKYIEAVLDQVMADPVKCSDVNTVVGIYTAVHNFCTASKVGDNPMHLVDATLGGGAELYQHLVRYLKNYLNGVHKRLRAYTGENILIFYIKEWDRYASAARYNDRTFRYLNHNWVKREKDSGKGIYDIYTLHLIRWRDDVFLEMHNEVIKAILELVGKQRNGEDIEQNKIKRGIDSLVSLGFDEFGSSDFTLNFYRIYFEKPFLAATREYYLKESRKLLAENDVVAYTKKAKARLREEEKRAPVYLLNGAIGPLMDECKRALIVDHSDVRQ